MSVDEKASAIIKHGAASDLETLVKTDPDADSDSYIVWAAANGKMPHVLTLHAMEPSHAALHEAAVEAAKHGHNDIALFLIDNGAYAQDNVLVAAADNNNLTLLDAVLERGTVDDHYPAVKAAILAMHFDTAIKLVNVMKELNKIEPYALRWA